jgi:hypothetical protein
MVAGQGGVFINYRGADSTGYAALIYAQLSARLGEDLVYLDSVSVPSGADYIDELLRAVCAADVMLAVIGAQWLTVTGPDGRRRIEEPTDWIRRELGTARDAGTVVIPVVTDDVTPPAEADLPADLRWLARRQHRRLRYREAGTDLARLIDELLGAGAGAGPEPGPGRPANVLDTAAPHSGKSQPRTRSLAGGRSGRPLGTVPPPIERLSVWIWVPARRDLSGRRSLCDGRLLSQLCGQHLVLLTHEPGLLFCLLLGPFRVSGCALFVRAKVNCADGADAQGLRISPTLTRPSISVS